MKNIIITGGELFNKGAQAMTFITVDEMKKRFPDHRILVLSEMDLERPAREKEKYAFEFMGWYPVKFAACQSNAGLRLLCKLRSGQELARAEEIYQNTAFMIDISGYGLGSNWDIENCNHYLEHLEFAKAFDIPVYLMPQSFGPFDFQGEEGRQMDERIAALLPGVRLICAREQEGYQALTEHYHLNNVILAGDLVLNNRGVDPAHIFKEIPKIDLPVIAPGSAAVIPNKSNYEAADRETVEKLYVQLIREISDGGQTVYLLTHSSADREICLQLKKIYKDNDRVIFLDREFDCLEFNALVRQFDFIAASRFHAIVHAFKNGVPCIALGWAAKYRDLMHQFEQDAYMLDVREEVTESHLCSAVDEMRKCHRTESKKILGCLSAVQAENVFDKIGQ